MNRESDLDNKTIGVVVVVIAIGIMLFLFIKGRFMPEVVPKGVEEFSYHFGFPTWGGQNNRSYGLNPFLSNPRLFSFRGYPFGNYYYDAPLSPVYGQDVDYYYNSIQPYLTKPCYSAQKYEDCVPGYKMRTRRNKRKKGENVDGDTSNREYQCCPTPISIPQLAPIVPVAPVAWF